MPLQIEASAKSVDLWHFRSSNSKSENAAHLRSVLSKYEAVPEAAWTFAKNDLGKPRIIAPATRLRYSVSHSAEHFLVGVSLIAELGVDIEVINPNFDVNEVAEEVLSPYELLRWRQDPSGLDFFKMWTIKESYLKAKGVGLYQPLKTISVESTRTNRPTIKNDADQAMVGWHALTSSRIEGSQIGVAAYAPSVASLNLVWR